MSFVESGKELVINNSSVEVEYADFLSDYTSITHKGNVITDTVSNPGPCPFGGIIWDLTTYTPVSNGYYRKSVQGNNWQYLDSAIKDNRQIYKWKLEEDNIRYIRISDIEGVSISTQLIRADANNLGTEYEIIFKATDAIHIVPKTASSFICGGVDIASYNTEAPYTSGTLKIKLKSEVGERQQATIQAFGKKVLNPRIDMYRTQKRFTYSISSFTNVPDSESHDVGTGGYTRIGDAYSAGANWTLTRCWWDIMGQIAFCEYSCSEYNTDKFMINWQGFADGNRFVQWAWIKIYWAGDYGWYKIETHSGEYDAEWGVWEKVGTSSGPGVHFEGTSSSGMHELWPFNTWSWDSGKVLYKWRQDYRKEFTITNANWPDRVQVDDIWYAHESRFDSITTTSDETYSSYATAVYYEE